MVTYPIYQVDAFNNELFKGNPAAVVILPSWLPDATMQNIAIKNNLSGKYYFNDVIKFRFNGLPVHGGTCVFIYF
jgi:predicted PhzF superfamily epimerase YddE/YHI9